MAITIETGLYFGHIDFTCLVYDGGGSRSLKPFDPKRKEIWMHRTRGVWFKIDPKNMNVFRLDDNGEVVEKKKIMEYTDTHMSFEPFKL